VSLKSIRKTVAAIFVLSAGLFFAAEAAAGTILKASCPCGFHMDSIMAGGGKANFRTFCAAPAYCAADKTMKILNYLEDAPSCGPDGGKPVFYNDPSLQERLPAGAQPKIVFSWNTDKKGVFVLPDVNYLCPRCGKMTLRFESVGFWD